MRLNVILAFSLLAFGCTEEKGMDPEIEGKKYATLEIIGGNNQEGITGRVLDDTLKLQVWPIDTTFNLQSFYVLARSGNGQITSYTYNWPPQNIKPDAQGVFKMKWQLDCQEPAQSMSFYLFYEDSCESFYEIEPNCDPIDSATITATSHTPVGWNKSCGIDWVDRYSTKIHSFQDKTYVVNQGTLFKGNKNSTLFWETIPGIVSNDIYDFGFTSSGTIYILTDDQGIYKSDDFTSWASVGSGILDTRYPESLLVEDSVVYASFSFDGLYRYRPADDFWRKLLIDGMYWEEYRLVTRHPNGDLYLVDKWDKVWVSDDSGDTWTRTSIDYTYIHSEIEDLKIHKSGLIYIGSGDATIAYVTPDTYTGESHRYYEWNASSQSVSNIFFKDSDVLYLVNSTPDPGIYSSANNWQNLNIDFEPTINLFHYDKSDYLYLGAYDGIYYYKN